VLAFALLFETQNSAALLHVSAGTARLLGGALLVGYALLPVVHRARPARGDVASRVLRLRGLK